MSSLGYLAHASHLSALTSWLTSCRALGVRATPVACLRGAAAHEEGEQDAKPIQQHEAPPQTTGEADARLRERRVPQTNTNRKETNA